MIDILSEEVYAIWKKKGLGKADLEHFYEME